MEKPRVIFLDAVGTLFGVRHSVGEAYRIIAEQFGVNAEAKILDKVFFNCFLAAPVMAFPGAMKIPAMNGFDGVLLGVSEGTPLFL